MDKIEEIKSDLLLTRLKSKEELQDWIYTYLDIKFPLGVVYPGSTHGPIESMWRIYELYLTGQSRYVPQVTMLASRDSYKTLAASAMIVLLMVHFRLQLATAGAIKAQSDKMIQYIGGHFRKIDTYLVDNGWQKLSESKSRTDWLDENGWLCFARVVVATVAGMNCVAPKSLITRGDMSTDYAKNIKKGDILTTFDYWENKYKEVTVGTVGSTKKYSRRIHFAEGHSIVVSDDHQIFTQKGWIMAEKLRPGFKCVGDTRYKMFPIADNNIYEIRNPEWNLKQMVLGTLAGDASINVLPSGSCRYQVFHCKRQISYLNAIARVFEKNNIKYNICEDNGGYKLTTQTHPYFKIANNLIKKDGKKTLSKEWLDKLDIQGISFILMDDGDCGRLEICKSKENNINFSLMGFSDQELQLFINRLSDFNLNAHMVDHGKYTNVRLDKDSSRNLSSVCKKHVIVDLQYKLISSKKSNEFVRNIETGSTSFNQTHNNGFTWEDNNIANIKVGRDFRKRIKNQLNVTVSRIELLGEQELVDIHIDTENEHEKSFIANNILVHNSEHVPFLAIDEVDVVQDPRALEEAKMIPCVYKNSLGETYFPLTVYLSTRKYAGGMMEKTLKNTVKAGGEILKWNILDVTERISWEEARGDEPKVLRYIATILPLRNLSPEEFSELNEESQHKYEPFEAYAGIAEHPMLSVMRNYLVDRPQDDVDNLYKPLTAVHNNFKQTSPDMGEAQLLCNKPSSSGLVYPRFDEDLNAIEIDEAWEFLTGDKVNEKTVGDLISLMHNLGIEFYGAADWGHTDETSIGVFAKISANKSWLVDMISAPEMEIPEIKDKMKDLTEIYQVRKWYCDSAYPAYIKMLRKTRTAHGNIPAIGVKKGPDSVIDGITCVQSNIVDSANKRHFKVLKTRNTERVFEAFGTYKWKMDGKGEPIDGKPEHSKDGTPDMMDMIRYFFHSMFGKGAKIIFTTSKARIFEKNPTIQGKIEELSGTNSEKRIKPGKNKGIIWDI